MNFYNLLLVGGGGFLGSIARYVTARSIDGKLNAFFPFGTLAVNLVGSFLLGIIYGWTMKADGQSIRLLLITGFCGGFTTFSAFTFENLNLIDHRFFGAALLYSLLSLVAGITMVWLGLWIGKTIG